MDGGVRQEEMAQRLKGEVRENSHLHRGGFVAHSFGDRASEAESPSRQPLAVPQEPLNFLATSSFDLLTETSASPSTGDKVAMGQPVKGSSLCPRLEANCMLEDSEGIASGWRNTSLLVFYLDNFLPFMFPFYHPSVREGGRLWILDIMMSNPVMWQTALCQSSYFFSLALETADSKVAREIVLTQTKSAFKTLRQSLQSIHERGVAGNLHEAVRIMARILQVQHFDIAVSSFDNCHEQLNATTALLNQILNSFGNVEGAVFGVSFDAAMAHLGSSSWILPSQRIQIPRVEQTAFQFSSALVILDDIIASIALQEQPKLYKHHHFLLCGADNARPQINFEAIIGCQNFVLLLIGEIAALDAWKQQRKRDGNLDVMKLVQRATTIKDSLAVRLARLEADAASVPEKSNTVMDVFVPYHGQLLKTHNSQRFLVTRAWAHAALIYLFVVVSGWQPASADVRYHVGRILVLLTQQLSSPALIRTMVWPFWVAGCLAEPAQEAFLRGIVEALQPPSVFGTVRKALEIMEDIWRNRDTGDAANRDFATFFKSQSGLVLLV